MESERTYPMDPEHEWMTLEELVSQGVARFRCDVDDPLLPFGHDNASAMAKRAMVETTPELRRFARGFLTRAIGDGQIDDPFFSERQVELVAEVLTVVVAEVAMCLFRNCPACAHPHHLGTCFDRRVHLLSPTESCRCDDDPLAVPGESS